MSANLAVIDAETGELVEQAGGFPMQLIEQAITSGANIDVLERLMGLQERWEQNRARKAFTAALSEVKNHLPRIVKSTDVSFGNTKYKHEDLGDMVESLTPVLAGHGLSFRFRPDTSESGKMSVTCVLSHRDGHFEEATLSGPVDNSGGKNAIQGIGSTTSYLQRYALKCILGIAASADDDGRQGAPQGQPPQQPPQQQDRPPQQQQAQKPKHEPVAVDKPTEAMIERFTELAKWRLNVEGGIEQKDHDTALEWLKTASKNAVGAKIGQWKEMRSSFEGADLGKQEEPPADLGEQGIPSESDPDADLGDVAPPPKKAPRVKQSDLGKPIGENGYAAILGLATDAGLTENWLTAELRKIAAENLGLSASAAAKYSIYNFPEGLTDTITGTIETTPAPKD